ncbi:MAG TPA: WG repeat-containing protein [Bacteroidales bacterium]|nr:WG repeat-containing protein [Bacteroidales bacterium]
MFIILIMPYMALSINNIKQLDSTIRDFGSLFLSNYSGTVSIEDFMIQFHEMQSFAPVQFDSVYVLKTFTIQTEKARRVFEYTKQQANNFTQILSYDTITRAIGNHTYLYVSIVYDVASPLVELQQKRRVFAKFVISGSTLKLWGKVQIMTDLEYYRTELQEVYDDRYSYFNKTYKDSGIAYIDTTFGFIPFQIKNLWGLQSLNGIVIIQPQFDSLYAFRGGVALVKKAGKYNLLKPDGSFVLSKWNSHIYCTMQDDNYVYWQKKSKNTYARIDFTYIPPKEIDNSKYTKQYYGSKNIVYSIADDPCHAQCYNIINTRTQLKIAEFKAMQLFERMGDFFFAVKQDTSLVIDSAGVILFQSPYVCMAQFPGNVIVYNRNTRLFGMYCPYTKQYIVPVYSFILPVERDKFFVALTRNYEFEYIVGEHSK